jgi:hypothetical protein
MDWKEAAGLTAYGMQSAGQPQKSTAVKSDPSLNKMNQPKNERGGGLLRCYCIFGGEGARPFKL